MAQMQEDIAADESMLDGMHIALMQADGCP
jgi:hypothetical protein